MENNIAMRFILILISGLFLVVVFSSFLGNLDVKTPISSELSCGPSDLSGEIDFTDTIAIFNGNQLNLPQIVFKEDETYVLGLTHEERWIEIDLSEQVLRAWEGNTLFLETPVSTGLPWWPTPTGEFRIWIKLRATKMAGGEGKYYYYLPNVPYVMYFENENIPGWRGFGLHGTYWHDDFGTPRSHGCVNLPTETAREIYYWVDPVLLSGKGSVRAGLNNLGTRIVIHE